MNLGLGVGNAGPVTLPCILLLILILVLRFRKLWVRPYRHLSLFSSIAKLDGASSCGFYLKSSLFRPKRPLSTRMVSDTEPSYFSAFFVAVFTRCRFERRQPGRAETDFFLAWQMRDYYGLPPSLGE